MNDRFKFRAYNKELRKMYEVNTICPYEDNHTKGGEVFLNGIQYNSFYFPEEVEVMQCTGLKDKNGTLIYEGDIIADVNCGCVATIEYLPCSYSLMAHIRRMDDFIPLEDICYTDKEGTPFEVIGNIYQDSHLLGN